jgi:mRNA interferase MazF
MKRGDLLTVVLAGDYGKPRPAVVIQSDWLNENDSVLVCLVTSTLRDTPLYRLTLNPNAENGLRETSQIMLDKITTVRRDKCGKVIGHLDEETKMALSKSLALVVGIAD